jgi:hypothetical protein
MKRYNAVSAIYRNRLPDFDDHLMLTAAGLWNFYLKLLNGDREGKGSLCLTFKSLLSNKSIIDPEDWS